MINNFFYEDFSNCFCFNIWNGEGFGLFGVYVNEDQNVVVVVVSYWLWFINIIVYFFEWGLGVMVKFVVVLGFFLLVLNIYVYFGLKIMFVKFGISFVYFQMIISWEIVYVYKYFMVQ